MKKMDRDKDGKVSFTDYTEMVRGEEEDEKTTRRRERRGDFKRENEDNVMDGKYCLQVEVDMLKCVSGG